MNRPTDAELREYVAAMEKSLATPCDCLLRDVLIRLINPSAMPIHTPQCIAGAACIRTAIQTVKYVLGEATENELRVIEMMKEMNK